MSKPVTQGVKTPGPVRVLIADDSSAIRMSLSALIARLPGVKVVGFATTGPEALQNARQLKPDVVTLDIRMPGMNGMAVLEKLRQEQFDSTVIILTGFEEAEYRTKCAALGASFYFHKSTEFEKVLDVLAAQAEPVAAAQPAA